MARPERGAAGSERHREAPAPPIPGTGRAPEHRRLTVAKPPLTYRRSGRAPGHAARRGRCLGRGDNAGAGWDSPARWLSADGPGRSSRWTGQRRPPNPRAGERRHSRCRRIPAAGGGGSRHAAAPTTPAGPRGPAAVNPLRRRGATAGPPAAPSPLPAGSCPGPLPGASAAPEEEPARTGSPAELAPSGAAGPGPAVGPGPLTL